MKLLQAFNKTIKKLQNIEFINLAALEFNTI